MLRNVWVFKPDLQWLSNSPNDADNVPGAMVFPRRPHHRWKGRWFFGQSHEPVVEPLQQLQDRLHPRRTIDGRWRRAAWFVPTVSSREGSGTESHRGRCQRQGVWHRSLFRRATGDGRRSFVADIWKWSATTTLKTMTNYFNAISDPIMREECEAWMVNRLKLFQAHIYRYDECNFFQCKTTQSHVQRSGTAHTADLRWLWGSVWSLFPEVSPFFSKWRGLSDADWFVV